MSKVFSGTPETWPGVQMAYNLWQAHVRIVEININRFETAGPQSERYPVLVALHSELTWATVKCMNSLPPLTKAGFV